MKEWLDDIRSIEPNAPWLLSLIQESVQLCPEYSIMWCYYLPEYHLQSQARK